MLPPVMASGQEVAVIPSLVHLPGLSVGGDVAEHPWNAEPGWYPGGTLAEGTVVTAPLPGKRKGPPDGGRGGGPWLPLLLLLFGVPPGPPADR